MPAYATSVNQPQECKSRFRNIELVRRLFPKRNRSSVGDASTNRALSAINPSNATNIQQKLEIRLRLSVKNVSTKMLARNRRNGLRRRKTTVDLSD